VLRFGPHVRGHALRDRRVTVERGIPSAVLISHAVARVRRNRTIVVSSTRLVRVGLRRGRDERSSSSLARPNHFATVRTLTPAAAAARRCVHPSLRTRSTSSRR